MLESRQETLRRMKEIIVDSEKQIRLINSHPCCYCKPSVLFRLDTNMKQLKYLCKIQEDTEAAYRQVQRQKEFTGEQLAEYTGKNGKPAYVAVNGVVYDVTGNAAWAAATHFGLSAGSDLTGAFNSCHVDPSVLKKLPVVGRLI